MYAVSSGFASTAARSNAPWRRRFTLGGSDYTSKVLKWPKIVNKWNDIKPGTMTIGLANEDRLFNFFLSSPTTLKNSGLVQLGFEYAVGSEEFITLFQGQVDAVRLREGECSITLADKFKLLSDRIVGDQTTPTNYVGSSYLVHDIAWYLCTSHGGLSAIQSTSNPDIDWASFNSWSSVFSADNTRVKAQFKGGKINTMLKRVSDMTQSAIRIENNKVKFNRFTIADTIAATLNDSTVMESDLTIDERAIINRVAVSADYNTTSDSFVIKVVAATSSSINSYSLKEELFDDADIWFVDSVSALNLAQRLLTMYDEPFGQLQVKSALSGIVATVGDTISFVDSFYGLNRSYRVMEHEVELDAGTTSYKIDDSQLVVPFTLDVSLLDGTDILA